MREEIAALAELKEFWSLMASTNPKAFLAEVREEIVDLRKQRDELAAALRGISNCRGKTLLGPDSQHRMGKDAPRHYEHGAAAAFEQAADLADAALKRVEES